ncbi:hypothetical protein Lal_00047155 [Lupinus albus]|uniref:Putative CRIB domain-containing protein n=1 Tax=Lupinus albus TaxID=3870 RepID=A0A6A4R1D9_LUPAL|nr:putative CRIB domain-containing protein [Lupinus albus]KAF1878486.1 hypothetical protein Lal_00047155 [Lupinus albus]
MASSTTNVKGQVKGLLKGLRYISQMFDEQGVENDIQIGFPTDVKHLAHIGCDDSQSHKPTSWMKEFKGPEEISSGSVAVNSNILHEDNKDNNDKVDRERHHNRRSKYSSSTENQSNFPNREQSCEGFVKQKRHHRSSESTRRHHRHSNNNESETEDEKLLSSTTKHSHRRKTKTSHDKEEPIRRSSKTTKKGSKESLLTESEVS